MKLVVEYSVDNAEFEPPNGLAIAMTLHQVQAELITAHDLGPDDGGSVLDGNGNTIGSWVIQGDE